MLNAGVNSQFKCPSLHLTGAAFSLSSIKRYTEMRWATRLANIGKTFWKLKWTCILRLVHTCNVTAYRKAITLQVTYTVRSYELNFHPVPRGVTVSCERYTLGFPVCYGSPSDVFAASSGFLHLYTLRFKEKEKRSAVVANATVHKQGSVQRFKFADRLEFSVGQCVIQGVPGGMDKTPGECSLC